ncbi:tetratricopeptide repeat protein [Larsenimonas suaedae]|uniref:Sel1 repeat family protein n=1 Tax=Larsenimonas suaedae TaxID=1851019 RepID=A0ABU1GVP3_9GAMM|nr:hypothetical protein [Larsenimonas suaedae]MCM2973218.1 hypothetical protein [Larsenimonas suaedae]MDR5896111.1 hypothetical protein [Larsenimonas suaedae]
MAAFLFLFVLFSEFVSADGKLEDGVYLYNIDSEKSAIPYLRSEAKEGDSIAQRLLAYKLSYMGSMTSESLKWYLASAENGDLYSMIALGRVDACKSSNFCSPDNGGWFDYFIKEAKSRSESNDGKAMRALSYYYGLIGDNDEKYRWLKRSAKSGYARAQYDLAMEIKKGKGFYWSETSRNKDVEEWYKKSSDNGFYPATIALSSLYFNVEKYKEGKNLLHEAFDDGFVGAFDVMYRCTSGMSLRYRDLVCGDLKVNKPEAWGIMLYMNDYGVYVDEASEYEDSFTYEERKEAEKYYQELKSKIPRLFGQRVVY